MAIVFKWLASIVNVNFTYRYKGHKVNFNNKL